MEGQYIKSEGIFYEGVLNDIKKSKNNLQPIFETFTNSLEAIKMDNDDGKFIKLNLYFKNGATLTETKVFDKIVVIDNGIGFDNENFERFKRYKDNRKGFNNKGSGRIQLLHFFNVSKYESIFIENGEFKIRKFSLSKKYINNNAIILATDIENIDTNEKTTTVTLKEFLEEKDRKSYENLSLKDLKDKIIMRYIMEFCNIREKLPKIELCEYFNNKLIENIEISAEDIPVIDKTEKIEFSYYSMKNNELIKIDKKEELELNAFKIESNKLEKNEIKFASKSEIVEDISIELETLKPNDHINNMRYLFLLSGEYINERDGDTRGHLKIPKKNEFTQKGTLFSEEELLIDDIQYEVNKTIVNLYDEIKQNLEKHTAEIDKLKKMFLLNEKTISSLSISLNDTEGEILKKVYTSESKIMARKDAEIKEKIEKLEQLNPAEKEYQDKFDSMISELVKLIPLQNRTALTHYVARRKLVLELFDKILKRELEIQKNSKRNIDEKLLHNLIFQQTSNDPEKSDLWLINEEFIYFGGTSEYQLKDIEIEGEKLLKDNLNEEEEKYRMSLNEDRASKRPDVLLFPNEGKCIIIEFKNPDKNVSEHLLEINRYASIINNLAKEKFGFHIFYGFLIGEKIDSNDVRDHDAEFIYAPNFDYLYRTNKKISGDRFGRPDGALYTEVIKYSTLLDRAKKRNEIFIKKLMNE